MFFTFDLEFNHRDHVGIARSYILRHLEEPGQRLKCIPVFEATHPDNKPYFREIATPKQVVCEGRAQIPAACSNCSKMSQNRQEFESAGTYSSSRPSHKTTCKETSSSIPKIITSFMANPLLHHFIQLSFIIDFKLNEYPILDRPFVLCCNVSIEPADMTYIMKLILGQLRGRSRQGLPGDAASQEIRLSECTRGIDDTRMEIWKNAKKGATEKGFTNAPVEWSISQ
ncbi:hypothetical protein CPB84DRAFT_1853448 [Gymnopilus junonius]|uniref:Uncharacterized protein n=1 Tax=Gymnopilus junonius TaxID=109634 RepID=A0A9P5N8M0_GYMJU|nr:hypothetical protein CPB84DRAFT_1853448 [Gymnopilus junonius]